MARRPKGNYIPYVNQAYKYKIQTYMSTGNVCEAVPLSMFWAPQLTQLIYWKCYGISIQYAWQISNGIDF